jgi:hypothetical protein
MMLLRNTAVYIPGAVRTCTPYRRLANSGVQYTGTRFCYATINAVDNQRIIQSTPLYTA